MFFHWLGEATKKLIALTLFLKRPPTKPTAKTRHISNAFTRLPVGYPYLECNGLGFWYQSTVRLHVCVFFSVSSLSMPRFVFFGAGVSFICRLLSFYFFCCHMHQLCTWIPPYGNWLVVSCRSMCIFSHIYAVYVPLPHPLCFVLTLLFRYRIAITAICYFSLEIVLHTRRITICIVGVQCNRIVVVK